MIDSSLHQDVYFQTVQHIQSQRQRLNTTLDQARVRMLAKIGTPPEGLPAWARRPAAADPDQTVWQATPGRVLRYRNWSTFPAREGRNQPDKPAGKGRGRKRKAA